MVHPPSTTAATTTTATLAKKKKKPPLVVASQKDAISYFTSPFQTAPPPNANFAGKEVKRGARKLLLEEEDEQEDEREKLKKKRVEYSVATDASLAEKPKMSFAAMFESNDSDSE